MTRHLQSQVATVRTVTSDDLEQLCTQGRRKHYSVRSGLPSGHTVPKPGASGIPLCNCSHRNRSVCGSWYASPFHPDCHGVPCASNTGSRWPASSYPVPSQFHKFGGTNAPAFLLVLKPLRNQALRLGSRYFR